MKASRREPAYNPRSVQPRARVASRIDHMSALQAIDL